MTKESQDFLAAALKKVKLTGGFTPADIGAAIGLDKARSEAAARALANAGVLVLGFDSAAHFSPAFRKSQAPAKPKAKAARPKRVRQPA